MDLQIDIKPLLRPAQLADARDERKSLEAKLHSPHIQDKGEVARQIRRLDKSLADQTPKPFTGRDKDAAVRMEAALRERILDGMPSQEEMRKAPPGAVEKHMAWEKRNKESLLQWKNLQLRMNAGSEDGSVANFERHRPIGSSLNMDNAVIQGRQFFMPPMDAGRGVTFTEAQLEVLEAVSPGLRERLALLSNDQRAAVKEALSAPESEPEEI